MSFILMDFSYSEKAIASKRSLELSVK